MLNSGRDAAVGKRPGPRGQRPQGPQGALPMTAAAGTIRTGRTAAGVAVVTIDNPPLNALTAPLRAALVEALAAAVEGGARAVVLAAAGTNFSAATSVDAAPGEIGGRPTLAELADVVEGLPVPVVAALHGMAIGPAAELALAAHARIAAPGLRMVFPEVGLGLPPQGGATQRLPRLVGVAEALAMLVAAAPATAEEALATGLVDRLADGDLIEAAVALAAGMPGPRPVADRRGALADVLDAQAAVDAARAGAARGVLPAPGRIIDCVEAALYLPFENGLALEAVAHEDLAATDESRGLIAAAAAERRAAERPAGLAAAEGAAVSHLGLLGHGPQMAPLALMALGHGLRVTWADPDRGRLDQSMRWIVERQEADLRAGRLSVAQRDADRARLATAADVAGLAGAGLVVHGAAGADLAALARAMPGVPQLVLGGAEGALGLGLAPSGRIAELAVPADAPAEAVATVLRLLRRLGLAPLMVGRAPVLGRRVSAAGRAALARILQMGVPRRLVEAALDGFGQPVPDLPDPAPPAPMRSMAEVEILRRWLAAMANEGFHLIDAGVARRPSDVDHVLVQGWGFPRWRGGPMHQAAQRGLMVLRADMHDWQADDPLWLPHPLVDRMIAEGLRPEDLDRAAGRP